MRLTSLWKQLVTASGVTASLCLTAPAVQAGENAGQADCERIQKMTWDQILNEAKGKTVNWWMWAGDPGVNEYVDQWVAPRAKELLGITVNRVPIKETREGVQQVVQEAQAGRDTGGAVDLNWISEANMKTLMDGDLLCRGYRDKLPNAKFIDWNKPTVAYDGDIAIEDWAIDWGLYQYVYAYNTAHVKEIPHNFEELRKLIKANPGKFTYPAPPDFTGRGLLMDILYEVSGGPDQWLKERKFDEKVWNSKQCALWDYLRDIKPFLWRAGQTYPETNSAQDQLYGSGELWFTISAYQAIPGRNVDKGVFPKTTKTAIVDVGTIAGNHTIGVPYNSSSKAASIALINFLLSPEAQYQKALPTVWGIGTILDLDRLPPEWQEKFKNIPRAEATLDPVTLGSHQVGVAALYNVPVEEGWRSHVLQDQPYKCD